MNETMNVVMMLSNGISQNLSGVTEYSKAKKAFLSINSTLETESTIDPTPEANRGKIEVKDLHGKIEFTNLTLAYPTKPEQKILKNISFVIEPAHLQLLLDIVDVGKAQ